MTPQAASQSATQATGVALLLTIERFAFAAALLLFAAFLLFFLRRDAGSQ